MRGRIAADQREDLDEGTATVGITRRPQRLQQRIPRIERQQHGQSTDIEDQDAVDDLIDRLRYHRLRIGRLCRRDADQLQTTEGEHDDRQRQHHAAETVGKEPAVAPEIADARLLAALPAHQQEQSEQDHADDGGDLDDGEPELGFTKRLHVAQVDQIDQHEERRGSRPGGYVRPPELHVLAHRRQLCHAHQHIKHPVVPAGQKACVASPVLVREMAEGTGYRFFDDHFPQLTHDQKGDEAADGVAQDHGRTGALQHPGGTQEQAGADRPAQGNQLDMAVFQASLQRPGVQRLSGHYATLRIKYEVRSARQIRQVASTETATFSREPGQAEKAT